MHSTTLVMYFALIFFFNATAPTEIYTLSLHDALPICAAPSSGANCPDGCERRQWRRPPPQSTAPWLARTRRARSRRSGCRRDRKSTRLNSSHVEISYAVFCLKKKKKNKNKNLNSSQVE